MTLGFFRYPGRSSRRGVVEGFTFEGFLLMGLCPFSVPTCLFSSKKLYLCRNIKLYRHEKIYAKRKRTKSRCRKRKTSREVLGKFFYDLAKIAFTGLVVGNALAIIIGEEKWLYGAVIAIGILGTYLFARIGYNIIKS